ncbi:Uu.00g077420.m01.CDS01 [Anthostomella pinea]|uniref:Uu.00g077420.m01.CDS01 n=1 Tax=Anthostomella pinea TaxID=933095 RepID=A0AAI8VW23_9PEZI|nr:Uu.00g077420.m01.CDS01 [Anthostomella pinea]
MPSRRILPKLSIFSSRKSSSSVCAPPSTNSTSTPLSPPARLHLRNVLPSSPDALMTPPPPPRQPRPWLWQCHGCLTVYRIGCTRRCLACGHTYCVSANPTTAVKSTRGKKRRRGGMCASEFDYDGWQEWGAWRRKVLGFEARGRCGQRERDRAFVQKTHNCMIDCDSPSRCHHRRYQVAYEALERKYAFEVYDEEPESPTIVASEPRSPDDDLPLNEALELKEGEDDDEEPKSPTSPKSPLSQSSFFWDEPERKKRKQKGEKIWWAEQKTSSPAVDTSGMDSHTLQGLMAEDDKLMPADINYTAGPRRTGTSSRQAAAPDVSAGTGTLTVRNLTDRDIWQDCESDSDESSDGDSDSDSNSDEEWVTSLAPPPRTAYAGHDSQQSSRVEMDTDKGLIPSVELGDAFLIREVLW